MAKKMREASDSTRSQIEKGFKQVRSLERGRRPYPMTVNDERGYIVENGIDREDRNQFRNDREGFRKKVSKMAEENEMKAMKNGKRYVNYPLARKK